MDKFRMVMVGFFILTFVNFVPINCFAMKSKNKQNKTISIRIGENQQSNKNIQNMLEEIKNNDEQKKIINIREDKKEEQNKKVSRKYVKNQLNDLNSIRGTRQASKNFQNFMQSVMKGGVIDNSQQEDEKNKKVSRKPNRKKQIKIEPILRRKRKRNNLDKKDEKNFNIKRAKKKFELFNRKNVFFNMKKIIETIKLNMIEYFALGVFNRRFENEKQFKVGIYKILEKNGAEDYSTFRVFLKKNQGICKYYGKIRKVNREELNIKTRKKIKKEIAEYFNNLKKDVFDEGLINKIKAIKKNSKKYKNMKKFFVGYIREYFNVNGGQKIDTFIEYIFDELKREINYSGYFDILKRGDLSLDCLKFVDIDIDKSKNYKKKYRCVKKYSDRNLIKLNILKILARDLIKPTVDKKIIDNILKKHGMKGIKRFCINVLKSGKNIWLECKLHTLKEEKDLNQKTKNKVLKELKKYFNGIKDNVLGKQLIKNLKDLETNSDKLNKLKKTINGIIKKYYLEDKDFNFDNIFEELIKEENHLKYLKSLKEYDLVGGFYFPKWEKYDQKNYNQKNKKVSCDYNIMRANIVKILAKDLLKKSFEKKCLNSFLEKYGIEEYKDFDFSRHRNGRNITYTLSIYSPNSKEIKNSTKNEMKQYLKEFFKREKKEIFESVLKDLKNIDIKSEKYNNMIKTLKKILKKYFIIEKGQEVEKMIKDIFDGFKQEINHDRYLAFICDGEILYDTRFSSFKTKKNKDAVEEDVEESDEEEDVKESDEEDAKESDEEEDVKESDEEEDVKESDEEEDVEESDEEGDKYGYSYDVGKNVNRGLSDNLNSIDFEQMIKIMNGYKDYESDENDNFDGENNFKEKTTKNFDFNINEKYITKEENNINSNDFFKLNLKNENNDSIL